MSRRRGGVVSAFTPLGEGWFDGLRALQVAAKGMSICQPFSLAASRSRFLIGRTSRSFQQLLNRLPMLLLT